MDLTQTVSIIFEQLYNPSLPYRYVALFCILVEKRKAQLRCSSEADRDPSGKLPATVPTGA